MNIKYIEFTSQGLVRSVNQDSVFSAAENEYGLFAVADGMGGHTSGEIASRRLTAALEEWWNGFCDEIYDFNKCYDDLRGVIDNVHKSIYEEFTEKGTICGTTIALVFIYSDRYLIINSGDSRIYSKNGMKLKQESVDHVFGVESVISGTMTAEAAKKSPNKNKLTAGVGCKKDLKIYIASAPLKARQFFICSDGVYKLCKRSDISAAMRKKNIISFLSKKIEKNGAADNFSFIRINISE